jgi:hypothetical protein
MSVFAASNLQAEQISVSWDGGGDGSSWGDPYNWEPNIVPDNDVNTFGVGISGLGVEVSLYQDRTISGLSCLGDVDLGPSYGHVKLTLTGVGLINYGELNIVAWGVQLFKIDGNVTNTSGALLDLWGAEIGDDLVNEAGGMVEVNGEVGIKGDFDNAGIVIAADELDVKNLISNVGQITIYGGGCGGNILDNDSSGVITGFGTIYGGERLGNEGTIYGNGGGSLVVVTGTEGMLINDGTMGNAAMASMNIMHYGIGVPSDVNNSGRIEVNAGGGVAFDSNLVNEPNGTIQLLGGNLSATQITQRADANLAGFGGITVDDEILIESGAKIELTGPTNIVGDVNIPTDATLEISDGTTLITGHTTCNNGTIHMIGGRVICQGGLTNNNCNIIWEPGTYTNIADFNLDGTVNFKDFAYIADTWLWQASWY